MPVPDQPFAVDAAIPDPEIQQVMRALRLLFPAIELPRPFPK